jgi:hypothetical protein
MTEEKTTKEQIIDIYKDIVTEKRDFPSLGDFAKFDISRDKIRTAFGNLEYLHNHMRTHHSDFLSELFSSVDDMFSGKMKITKEDIEPGRYVITTAVANAPVDETFMDALTSYCKLHSAKLIIMPCESVTNSFENKTAVFDSYFNNVECYVAIDDVPLNDNFSICSIQVSAKQIKSITGLSRLGNREGSYVFASPKQFLEYVPSGNNRGKNYAIMTPGACTRPAYFTETFVSKRLSYIAERDHTIGAIIVDIKNDRNFDFRQIQSNGEGSFCDMGIKYNPDGTTEEVSVNLVFGDLHGVHVDKKALDYFIDLTSSLNVDRLFLHDVFDGYSISHHIKDIAVKASRHAEKADVLSTEIQKTLELIKYVDERVSPKELNIVKSNHDEFLDRYLSAGNYISDPVNHYMSLKIATALFEDRDVLQHAFEVVSQEKTPSHWNFLDRDQSYKIGGVECASHGDLGMNGARPSLNSLEKIYGSCVVGHNHSAAIQRSVFRVGTLSKLDMDYNRGPSSWTHTCCILYADGQRQLINYIE